MCGFVSWAERKPQSSTAKGVVKGEEGSVDEHEGQLKSLAPSDKVERNRFSLYVCFTHHSEAVGTPDAVVLIELH